MKKYEYVNVHIDKFFGAKSEEHRNILFLELCPR